MYIHHVITFLVQRWKSISLKKEETKEEEEEEEEEEEKVEEKKKEEKEDEKTSSVSHTAKILKNLDLEWPNWFQVSSKCPNLISFV